MKKELIVKLFNEFTKDKKLIAKNLMEALNIIVLETKDEYGTLTMTIEYKKNKED